MVNTTKIPKIAKEIKIIVEFHLNYKENLDDNKFKIINKDFNENNSTKDNKYIKKCIQKINYDFNKTVIMLIFYIYHYLILIN